MWRRQSGDAYATVRGALVERILALDAQRSIALSKPTSRTIHR